MSKYVYLLIIVLLCGCTSNSIKTKHIATNTIIYPTTTKTIIHPTITYTIPQPTATWESIIRFVPTLTSMPEIDYESIIQEGNNFPDVVSIEKRNGEYRAVDERGLSRYALRDWTWVEIPQIKPSDITEDDRMYYEPITHISREPFPFGIKKIRENEYPGYPDIENWAITGVLLEEPFVRSEGTQQLVFKVGFPIGDKFAVLNVITINGFSDYPDFKKPTYLFFEAPRSHPGFNSYMVSGKVRPLDEATEKLKNAVGRQVYMEYLISDSEQTIEYLYDRYEKEVPDDIEKPLPFYYIVKEMEELFPETKEVFANLKLGNFKAVDSKYFFSWQSRPVFPVTPKK